MRNHPRPRELTSTVIISDIAKTESKELLHHALFRHCSWKSCIGPACARLSFSADEQKQRKSSEIASEGKMAGREKGIACKHLLACAQYRVQIPQVARTYVRDMTGLFLTQFGISPI